MQNENLNSMHWKDKLEDAENLPGETVQNKNAAWKKLHSRLRQKRRSKRVVWVCGIAASLFLAIIIPLFYADNYTNNIVINSTKKGAATKPPFTKVEPVKSVAVIMPAQSKKQKKENILIEKTTANTTIYTAKNDEAIKNNNELVKSEKFTPLPIADSALAPQIASAIIKKKLKVIHINELGDEVEESPEIARTSEQHLFQLKLAQQEIYNASATASNKNSIVYFLKQ